MRNFPLLWWFLASVRFLYTLFSAFTCCRCVSSFFLLWNVGRLCIPSPQRVKIHTCHLTLVAEVSSGGNPQTYLLEISTLLYFFLSATVHILRMRKAKKLHGLGGVPISQQFLGPSSPARCFCLFSPQCRYPDGSATTSKEYTFLRASLAFISFVWVPLLQPFHR